MVAYNVQGPKDIVKERHTGLLVDEISPESFADAVREIVNHHRLMTKMGRQARAYAESCTWQKIMGGMRNHYHELATTTQAEPARMVQENRSVA